MSKSLSARAIASANGTTLALDPVPTGRPSWSGLLQLSLVGIPIKAYPAVRTSEVSHFHHYHADCGQRIRYHKHCPLHGPVETTHIVRGFDYGAGKHVVIEAEELDKLRPARDRALSLERFIEPAQLDPVLFAGRTLYLYPDGSPARHAYHVLRTVMQQRGRWALGRVVLATQRHLVVVRPTPALLVLHLLHFPEQVQGCAGAGAPAAATDEERRLAGLLIDAASGTVDWQAYRDQRADELRTLIEAKLADRPVTEVEPIGAVLSLLEALKQSVATTATSDEGRVPGRRPANGTARKRGKKVS